MDTSTTERPGSDVDLPPAERSRLSITFAVLVAAAIVATIVVVVALATDRSDSAFVVSPGDGSSQPRQIEVLTDGYVEVDWRDVPSSDLGPLRASPLVTTPEADANLRAQGYDDLPTVNYERSFLLLAEWDGCPRDRALVVLVDQRLWVEEEETNIDCEAPEWIITPVVIDWSVTGDAFSYGQATRPLHLVKDRVAQPVERLAPAATRHGVERGLREPGPERPEVVLATSAADRDALVDHPAFPSDGRSILDQTTSPVVFVVTNGCTPAWSLAVADGEAAVLRPTLDWLDCAQTTSSALFVLDDRFPELPFNLSIDDFLNPTDVVELPAGS